MKNMIKTLCALVAFSATAGYADQNTPAPEMMDPNPSARWETKETSNLFLTGEVIFFKPLVDELSQSAVLANSLNHTAANKQFHNVMKPGVRVALGCNTNYNGWDMVLSYTGLRYHHSHDYVSTLLSVTPFAAAGKISYRYNVNVGDLDLGRMYQISSKLNLRPHAGVRGLWLRQQGLADVIGTVPSPSHLLETKRLNGALIGLEAGLDSFWMLTKRLCVYGNFGFATLVNSQNASDVTADLLIGTVTTTSYSRSSRIINGIDFSLGLRWDKNFSNDEYHFGVNFGYEQHSYFNINSTAAAALSGTGTTFTMLSEEDFTLQGFALGVRLDF